MKLEQKQLRRIACNELITSEGQHLTLQCLTIEKGYVVRMHPLEREEAQTEWMQGQIKLIKDEGGLCAYYQGKRLT